MVFVSRHDDLSALPKVDRSVPVASDHGQGEQSGYGLQRINPVFVKGYRARLKATLNLVDVNGMTGIPAASSVMVSGDAATGAICFGDSGDPQFLNDTKIVAAVTSFGLNGNCAGVGVLFSGSGVEIASLAHPVTASATARA